MSKQRIQWHCFNEVNEKYDIIDQGGFSKTAIKGQVEESLRSLKSGDIFVEIGVLCGGSLFNFYEFVSNPEVEFVGIDVWENQTSCNGIELENWDEEDFKKFIKVELDCRKKVENIIKDNKFNIKLIQLESTESVYSGFDDESIGFLHLDGNHSFESVYQDLETYYPKMKKGGMILFDDWQWPEVREGIMKFLEDKNLNAATDVNGLKAYIIK